VENSSMQKANTPYSKVNKSTRAKVAVFFYLRFSVIILSVLLQQSKSELASHTSSQFFITATTQKA
jgi:hypothetical protein